MSARTRGKPQPQSTRWHPEDGKTGHEKQMRNIALSRHECKVCGGIPKARAVQVVHMRFGKVWWWHLCGPCQVRLENGELIDYQGLGVC